MIKFAGYLFAWSVFTGGIWLAQWAFCAFVVWDLRWLDDIAEWDAAARFSMAIFFGIPAAAVTFWGAHQTWGDE